MDLFIPDDLQKEEALHRTTHLAIGAHPDDLEIMAYHGISSCFNQTDQWFGGIVVTNGSGSSRQGRFSSLSNEEMVAVRNAEQKSAARIGQYGFVAQLGYTSSTLDDPQSGAHEELLELLHASAPKTVYLHNPADKHPTHISVLKASLRALRSLPAEKQPTTVYGCEVWRDLDWLPDESKVTLDCSPYPELALELIRAFESQIEGNKRYDLAAVGRRQANATFSDPRTSDRSPALSWAVDLTRLIQEPELGLDTFMQTHLDRFRFQVLGALKD